MSDTELENLKMLNNEDIYEVIAEDPQYYFEEGALDDELRNRLLLESYRNQQGLLQLEFRIEPDDYKQRVGFAKGEHSDEEVYRSFRRIVKKVIELKRSKRELSKRTKGAMSNEAVTRGATWSNVKNMGEGNSLPTPSFPSFPSTPNPPTSAPPSFPSPSNHSRLPTLPSPPISAPPAPPAPPAPSTHVQQPVQPVQPSPVEEIEQCLAGSSLTHRKISQLAHKNNISPSVIKEIKNSPRSSGLLSLLLSN